jgi:hypothetical protein
MATLTRLERLNRRGIIAFEIDGILARLTKAQSAKPEIDRAVHEALTKQAAVVAADIRARVQLRGELAGQTPSKRSRRRIILSADYARAAKLQPASERFGLTVPGGIAALYAKTGRPLQSYTATGGMWEGLQARASGANSAIIDFAGSSEGRGKPIFGRPKDGTRKTLIGTSTERVRNQWKAGGIFAQTGVHVLLPTQDEADRAADGIMVRLQTAALAALLG